MHFTFVASDHFDMNVLNSVESFVDNYPDSQTVWLKDENELKLLLELMGIHEFVGCELNGKAFNKYWDISKFKFPELDNQQYDRFYESWIKKSKRDNNMNEYGSIIFLQGLSSKWNRLKYRLIIKED